MAKGKEMSAVVSIAGAIDPSLGKSISSAQKSISGLGSSLKTIGLIGVGVAAVAGVTAIGAAAYEAGTKLYNMGEEWKKSQNLIRIGTGKTGAELGKLEKSFENTYAQFEGSKDLVAQTIADINTLTDAEGKALEDYAINALNAADLTKIDTGTLVKTTSAFFKAFNVDNDDMAGMTDYIFKVNQATGVGMDKLAEYSQRNAAAFKELGLGAKQSIALIGQMTKAGVDIDSAMAGMKKAVVSLTSVDKKTGKAKFKNTQEALEGIVGKISNAETKQEALQTAMEVFGKKAGNEMATAIREGKFSIADFVKAMDESKETIAKVDDDTELVGDKFTLMWHQIELALKPLSEKVYAMVGRIAAKLQTALQKVMPVFQEWLAKLDPYIQQAETWINNFIDNIDMDQLVDMFRNVGKALKGAFEWFMKNGATIWKWFKIIAIAVGVFIGIIIVMKIWIILAIAAVVAGLIWMVENWDEITAAIGKMWDVLCNWLGTVWNGFVGWLKSVWDSVAGWFSSAWEWLEGLWSGMCEGLSQGWDSFCQALQVAWNTVVGWLSSGWESLKGQWDKICAFYGQAWENFCLGSKIIWEKLMSWFSGTVSRFREIGTRIADALKAAFMKFRDWVMEMIDNIGKKFRAVFDGIKNIVGKLNPFGGNNDAPVKAYAAGGFTSGPSICGEAGTEAVISFDPAHRAENQGYLMTAAQMLGMVAPSSAGSPGRQSVINIGGVTFAPVINTKGGSGSDKSILEQLEVYFPDFMDKIEAALAERERRRYA